MAKELYVNHRLVDTILRPVPQSKIYIEYIFVASLGDVSRVQDLDFLFRTLNSFTRRSKAPIVISDNRQSCYSEKE